MRTFPGPRERAARRVDQLVVGSELGRVHLGRNPMRRRSVTLKRPPGGDPEQQSRLLREARNQAGINHPNVCRIPGLGGDPAAMLRQRLAPLLAIPD